MSTAGALLSRIGGLLFCIRCYDGVVNRIEDYSVRTVTLMDHTQLAVDDTIQKPMMNASLPKMLGYSLKPCRHLVFGPQQYLGIGARDLVIGRGIQSKL